MRRGSVFTYAEEGRRNSANMAQLELPRNRTEFAVDNIKYNREGGCFVSHKKFGISLFIVLICIIAAGFIGAYVASLSDKKVHDPLELLQYESTGGSEDLANKFPLSSVIFPLRYNVTLTPIFIMKTVSKIKGRIIIDFRQNDTKVLDKLILNAQNIKPIKYRLVSLKKEMHSKSRKKREPEEDNPTTVTSENVDVNITTTDNPTTGTSEEEVGTPTTEVPDTITILPSRDNSTSKLENLAEEAIDNVTVSHDVNKDNGSTQKESNTTHEPGAKETVEKNGERGEYRRINENLTVDLGDEILKDVIITNCVNISNYEINEVGKVHVIHPAVPIEPGNYSLEIEYEVPVNNCGIFITNFTAGGESRWLMATQLKPTNAHRLFPVFDDMKFKAHFSLSVSRPREMKVLSNMPLKMSNDSSDGQVLDIFEETPLLSPHNLAFVEGNIQLIVKTNYGGDFASTISFWGDPEKSSQISYLSDKIDVILDKFVNLFSITYPMKKMDLIGLPMTVDGTGSPGLISIKEQLFYVREQSPIVLKMHAVKNLIHQVGGQWLGGLINTQNWTDAWLLEGSLIYFSHAFLKEIDPAFDTSGSFESDVQWKMMDRDAYSVSRSLQSKVYTSHLDNFDTEEHYYKGACLIRMLHGVLNDIAFRSGYQKFVSRWIYGNGNLNAFWEDMSEGAKNIFENLTLNDVMSSWIIRNGYPVVSVKRNYENGSASINQMWFTYDNSSTLEENLWYIPLTFVDSNGNWSFPTKIWLKSKSELTIENVGVSNQSWVVCNIDGIGYYRVNYDNDNWKLLGEALKENHKQFPPATRASLIDDVLSLAQGGRMSYEVALNFVNYMRTKEKHYAPWAALTAHLLKLKFALYDTIIYQDFQIFVRNFLSTIYNELESKQDEGSQLVLLVKKVACIFEHPQCLDWARKTFAVTKTSGITNLPMHTREIFYCTAARDGGEEDWQFLLQKAINATDKEEKNQVLSSLACFQVPWILQKVLKMIVEEKSFTEEESRIILHSFSRNPEAAFAVQRYVERNWSEIITRYKKSYSMMKGFIVAMAKALMTKQDLVKFQEFRDNNYDSLKIIGYNVVLAEVESSAWVQWRNISLPVIKAWIDDSNK